MKTFIFVVMTIFTLSALISGSGYAGYGYAKYLELKAAEEAQWEDEAWDGERAYLLEQEERHSKKFKLGVTSDGISPGNMDVVTRWTRFVGESYFYRVTIKNINFREADIIIVEAETGEDVTGKFFFSSYKNSSNIYICFPKPEKGSYQMIVRTKWSKSSLFIHV